MSGSSFAREAAYSVFEALRPTPGQTLDRLAIATYSLDLVAVAALILSLSRAGEQELEAGPLSFVDALNEFAPRIDIVHQKDRLRPADQHYGILHLLDRRLHAATPKPGASYHPKLALGRYLGPGQAITWKLWLGSRNLTGGQDREAGLLLVGHVGGGRGTRMPDIAKMTAELLVPVVWVGACASELAGVRWEAPQHTKLRRVQWRCVGQYRPFMASLQPADRVVAISPFVDNDGCSAAFDGSSDNRLLTTEPAARRLNADTEATILVAGSPLLGPPMLVDPPVPTPAGETPEVPDPPGLHAKLLLRQRGARTRLWIGSANLTGRGMNGPNAEVLAELDVPSAVANDLIGFVDCHLPLNDGALDPVEERRRGAERALDEAIAVLVAVGFSLSREPDGLHLAADDLLDAFLVENCLDAWLLTRPDAVTSWPAHASSVLLVPGGVPLKLETVLVCFSAARLAGDCPPRRWAQAVPFLEHNADVRDQAAIAAYIGLSGASAWLRAQLEGIVPAESTTWTGAHRWDRSEHSGAADQLPVALEEVLAAWARNPDQFETRARGLDTTLAAIGEQLHQTGEEAPAEVVARWREVERFWSALQQTIGAKI